MLQYVYTNAEKTVIQCSDGRCIPVCPGNLDYDALIADGAEIAEYALNTNDVMLAQIEALEVQQTRRRMREAALSEEGRLWLEQLESQIEALRAQLT